MGEKDERVLGVVGTVDEDIESNYLVTKLAHMSLNLGEIHYASNCSMKFPTQISSYGTQSLKSILSMNCMVVLSNCIIKCNRKV